jgi:hypothetical protein
MLDDLNNSPGAGAQRDGAQRDGARPVGQAGGMSDREIPIVTATPFDAMHRWLDGEGSEAAAVQDVESARYVALWRRVGQETARRSSQRLSSDFTSRVMSALPGATPARADLSLVTASATAAPMPAFAAAPAAASHVAPAAAWWQGPLEMNRGTALAAATGLVAVGLLLGVALRGQ